MDSSSLREMRSGRFFEKFTFSFSLTESSSQSSENSLKLNRQYAIDCGWEGMVEGVGGHGEGFRVENVKF